MPLKLLLGLAVTVFTGGASLPVLGMVMGGTLVGAATEEAFYITTNVTNGEWNTDD